ncbi:DUF1801 domain-containing protein [Sulfidibacter corallicola]|uniref:DUF1801 domain-containing protein n=1 Tax=Sulfidibacter corallicola TaxID=2818388 RepID=A0A8A4TJ12_SULCO|nr:DUF1801 domain-containing protein [Sulfidibacter corallicola]QTD50019.1 DUF1801 domain-containing protein [Sulfidibacter corallicola]
MTDNQKTDVDAFLRDTQLVSPENHALIIAIRDMFRKADASFGETIKYGGLVFMSGKDLVGGIFVYRKHLSIEFSVGAGFADPDGFLEGKGKHRRHLKIRTMADLEAKKVATYIAQTVPETGAP